MIPQLAHQFFLPLCIVFLIGLAFLDAHGKGQITVRFICIQAGIGLVAIWLAYSG